MGAPARVLRPRSVEELRAGFELVRAEGLPLGLRGGGNSYGDASVNERGHVLDVSRLDRWLAWDPATGRAEVEAGVTIEALWKRILPDGWVEYTRTPAPADPARRYGAHFWLDVPDGYRTSGAALPRDAFHAAGHQGQFVTIVPSRRLVLVRLGGTRHHDAWDHTAFVHDVLEALGLVGSDEDTEIAE